MQVVQGDEQEWKRGLQHRGGVFHYRNLLEGEAGTLGNFQLSVGRSDRDFNSPRHRHNFEQFRFQLEGDLSFGRDGMMKPGMVGYFPEGASYGPQSQEMDALTIVLQFGGASGAGYLSRAEVLEGMKALEAHGEFRDGVFRPHKDAVGYRNLDGYQAIWEHARGRRLDYPAPRYPGPIMMDSAHFSWVASAEPGVSIKTLGVFTERRAECGMTRLDAGARHTLPARSIHVCIGGSGEISATGACVPLRPYTTIHVDAGVTVAIDARAPCQLLRMILPDLSGLDAAGDAPVEHSHAAE